MDPVWYLSIEENKREIIDKPIDDLKLDLNGTSIIIAVASLLTAPPQQPPCAPSFLQLCYFLYFLSSPELIRTLVFLYPLPPLPSSFLGYDIRKAVRMLRESNCSILEWLTSPIVYSSDPTFFKGTPHAALSLPQHHQKCRTSP